jgi:uncharacterized protein YbaR (Trm112 family)/ubiquinone/menaquinone biosynthesis C-methylase UbiE
MKDWALKFLACPRCKGDLLVDKKKYIDDEVYEGFLICNCGSVYSIKNSIPRFINDSSNNPLNIQKKESVDSFAFEWNVLNFDRFYKNWIEHIVKRNFIKPSFFGNKIILDCGAGSGMQSRWMLELGAKYVISLELSDAVDGIVSKNLQGFSNSQIVQCDLGNPPIKSNVVDLIYCINVIQHTEDPAKTTSVLYQLLGKNSELYINYYRYPIKFINRIKLGYGEFARKHIIKKLSHEQLLRLIKWISLIVYIPILDKFGAFFLNYGEFTSKSKKHRYQQAVLNTYDILGSHHYQRHYKNYELIQLFKDAEIDTINIKNFSYVMKNHKPGLAFKFTKKF